MTLDTVPGVKSLITSYSQEMRRSDVSQRERIPLHLAHTVSSSARIANKENVFSERIWARASPNIANTPPHGKGVISTKPSVGTAPRTRVRNSAGDRLAPPRVSQTTTPLPTRRLLFPVSTAPKRPASFGTTNRRTGAQTPSRRWKPIPFRRPLPVDLWTDICRQLHPILDKNILEAIAHTCRAGRYAATGTLLSFFAPVTTRQVERLIWGERSDVTFRYLPTLSSHEAIKVLDLTRLDLTDFMMCIRRYHPAPRLRDDMITQLVPYQPLFPSVRVLRFCAPSPPWSPFIRLGKMVASVPLLHQHTEYGGFGRVEEICTELGALHNDARPPGAWREFFKQFLADQQFAQLKPVMHYHLDKRRDGHPPDHLAFSPPGAHNRFYVSARWNTEGGLNLLLKSWTRMMFAVLLVDPSTTWEFVGLTERLSPLLKGTQLADEALQVEIKINERLVFLSDTASPSASCASEPVKLERWKRLVARLQMAAAQSPISVSLENVSSACPACTSESKSWS